MKSDWIILGYKQTPENHVHHRARALAFLQSKCHLVTVAASQAGNMTAPTPANGVAILGMYAQ